MYDVCQDPIIPIYWPSLDDALSPCLPSTLVEVNFFANWYALSNLLHFNIYGGLVSISFVDWKMSHCLYLQNNGLTYFLAAVDCLQLIRYLVRIIKNTTGNVRCMPRPYHTIDPAWMMPCRPAFLALLLKWFLCKLICVKQSTSF